MVGIDKRDRRIGAGSLGVFATAILVGAGATALALSWISRTKQPEKILERCDSALHELQDRLDHLQAA